MSAVDAAVVIASLVGLLALAGWIARRQRNTGDDYLGGRHLPAWAVPAGGCGPPSSSWAPWPA